MKWKQTLQTLKEKYKVMNYYFSAQKDMILLYNLHIYQATSVFCLFTVFLYTLTTGLLLRKWNFTIYHGILLALLIIHIIISAYVNKHRLKSKTFEKALCVIFSLCVFIMLICFDTVVSPTSSQTFCGAFLVVAPCIFVMNFQRMFIDQLFFVVVYGFFAFKFKELSYATHDMYAIWTGFFFGIILYYITMDLRMQVNTEVMRLKHVSETDELTKINNRREADAQISYMLEHRDEDSPCALMMLDVDFFKTVNDTYGHQTGDEVLKEVANVLAHSFRKTDVVARYGGDEFIVFVTNFGSDGSLPKKCDDIQNKVRQIFHDKMNVSCSIGVCMLTSGKRTMEEIIAVADEALYKTKERQRGTYTISIIK